MTKSFFDTRNFSSKLEQLKNFEPRSTQYANHQSASFVKRQSFVKCIDRSIIKACNVKKTPFARVFLFSFDKVVLLPIILTLLKKYTFWGLASRSRFASSIGLFFFFLWPSQQNHETTTMLRWRVLLLRRKQHQSQKSSKLKHEDQRMELLLQRMFEKKK